MLIRRSMAIHHFQYSDVFELHCMLQKDLQFLHKLPCTLYLSKDKTGRHTWKTMCLVKTCLTQLTTYSVSDSVSSVGLSDDRNRGPS